MTEEFEVLRRVAREYCDVIEAVGEQEEGWLKRVVKILPQLHAAISAVLELEKSGGNPVEANLEMRFSLFSKLHQLLGEKDAYWMEYDLGHEECRSGSLADDLTDIYCELKQGLQMLENGGADPVTVLLNWREGYKIHWGKHLLDAERHLYELSSKGNL
ncbi:MAG TPA: DUF5063 domain-containing protein [Chromatiaceae bacterium]|nr:DUF5063 domain-containing protein [Chromatiaceae bacterium]